MSDLETALLSTVNEASGASGAGESGTARIESSGTDFAPVELSNDEMEAMVNDDMTEVPSGSVLGAHLPAGLSLETIAWQNEGDATYILAEVNDSDAGTTRASENTMGPILPSCAAEDEWGPAECSESDEDTGNAPPVTSAKMPFGTQ